MLAWLNQNAAAVQAMASIASVVVTIVLLGITWQYVGLTQELARAAREQLRFQQRTAASEAAQLITLIDVFLGTLKRFPSSEHDAEQIRDVSLWKHADVSAFGSLAASILGTHADVRRAIQRLNWLHNIVDQAQQTTREGGRSEQLPWEEWNRQLTEARTALQTGRADAQSAEAPAAS